MRGGEGQVAVQAHQLPHHAAEGRAEQLRGKGTENGARQQVEGQPRLLALEGVFQSCCNIKVLLCIK